MIIKNTKSITISSSSKIKLKYNLYLPENYQNKKFPLILFLHGAGERGDDLFLVETHGIPKLIKEGEVFPFIVVAPQCPSYLWWSDPLPIHLLSKLMDKIVLLDFVDKNRIYCTGLSMGGYGTLALSLTRLELFSAIIPICGGLDIKNFFEIEKLYNIPIWMFHGDKDDVVPLEKSKDIYKALKTKNKNIRLTIYKNIGHNSWEKAYSDKRIYEWLLKFKKNNKIR